MSAVTVRKRRKRNVTRLPLDRRVSDILKAAREVVEEKGYEGVTMSEIAERADIVEGTVYRYFKNKDELLLRVAEEWFVECYSDLVDGSAFSGVYNKLRYLIWHSLKTIKAGRAISRYVMTEVRPKLDYKDTAIFELNRGYTAQMRNLFREAIDSGEFQHDVPERLLRDMVFGTIEHSTWRFLRGEGDFDPAEVADEIAAVVYRGMSAKPLAEDKFSHLVTRLAKAADRLAPKKKA
jgi:TetR/AcrR family fatty acid metabolism transcriptional regulator